MARLQRPTREQLPLLFSFSALVRCASLYICRTTAYMQLAFRIARRDLATGRAGARAAAAASVSALGRTELRSLSVTFLALDALRSYVQLALVSHGKMARRPLPTSGQLLMLQLRSLSVTFFALDVLRSHTRQTLASRGK
jgi:hypothetical protein